MRSQADGPEQGGAAGLTEDDLVPARVLRARGADAEARALYLSLLARDPTHFQCLTELGNLAYESGFVSAARTVYEQAVRHHPGEPVAHVNLANLLRRGGDLLSAKRHFALALQRAPGLAHAHQGLAFVLAEEGDVEGAARHRHLGFRGNAIVHKPHRGAGQAPRVLLLVSALGGNIPVEHWLTDRTYDITAIHAEFAEPGAPLPAHDIIVNLIGDADLCAKALERACQLCAASDRPVINHPRHVLATGRADTATQLGSIAHLRIPRIRRLTGAAIRARDDLSFPVLLRRPGFHTGQHFLRADTEAELSDALGLLDPAGSAEILLIGYLDARGPDGLARKYRMMFIGGRLYPLHLALSTDWKVHYFTSAMATDDAYRREEQAFLDDPIAVLGADRMRALGMVAERLGLDYAGIDFGLDAEGRILVFEVNATMVLVRPEANPIWDYRRPAIGRAFDAAEQLVADRIGRETDAPPAPKGQAAGAC